MKPRDYFHFAVGPMLILALLSAQGCAICREHPVACMAGSAIVAGSIAYSIDRDHGRGRSTSNTQPVPCASNPALCQ